MNIITMEDANYLAQQSSGRINMILSSMTALMNDTDNKVATMESQGWFRRMIKTVTGKNKLTKVEIQKNHDKLNAYMSEAIAELYNRNCIDHKVMMSLGTQLNELYADHIQLKQMLGAFVSKLNEKIDSVDNFHMLTTEIDQGVYSASTPIVSICNVISQFDNRILEYERKLDIIKRGLREQKIINDDEILLTDYLKDIVDIPVEEMGRTYLELGTIRGNFMADIILRMMENYHFLTDMERRLKNKDKLIEELITREGLDASMALTSNEIYDDFINNKIDVKNGLIPIAEIQMESKLAEAEALFIDCKLEEAFVLFESLAEKGNGRAMYFLGEYYAHPYRPVCLDLKRSEMWRLKGRDAGDILSSLNVAYTSIKNSPESKKIISELFNPVLELAQNGDLMAQDELSDIYINSSDSPDRYEKAVFWLTKAADSGYWRSLDHLAFFYYDKGEYAEAIKWWNKSMEFESDEALTWLGILYQNGIGVEKDYHKAFGLFEHAAKLGNPEAKNRLGVMFYDGLGTEQNYSEAIKWYNEAIKLGNTLAMYNLAGMYYNGIGVEQDYHKAFELHKQAADLKNSESQNMLGIMFHNGLGTEQNYSEAIKWYNEAIKLGDTWAMYNLAGMYYNGNGIEQDHQKAFGLYKQAADLKLPESQNMLGVMFNDGLGTEQNYSEAIKWYNEAIKLGDTWAMYNLAGMYYNGNGIEQDHQKAFGLYKQAAELGNDAAMSKLSICYQQGYGVNSDTEKSKEWALKAAAQGNDTAKENLKEWFGIVI